MKATPMFFFGCSKGLIKGISSELMELWIESEVIS
jgi:hypothetical protein